MEKVLPYNREIVAQERYWWCGPASIQNTLDARGISKSEYDLMRELEALEGNPNHDDQDGTDSIHQVCTVLNRYLSGGYVVRELRRDPPTAEEAALLWDDIVKSINADFPVVVNIVAPPSNYPRGVKGSVSPTYKGGTIYHYMTVMGYDDVARACWIADSGFSPFGYWISFDQLASLIPPKGYTAKPVGVSVPAPAQTPGLTAETLADVMGRTVGLDRYRQLLPALTAAMKQAGCTTLDRAAMFLAQLGHESVGLKYMEEIWGPTSDQNTYQGRMGNNAPGDGYRYRGRGPIQITGRDNYSALSRWAHTQGYVPSPSFFVDRPNELSGDQYGFLGAVWYWTQARDMNSLAGDIRAATKAINGGYNGLDDRTARWNKARAMGDRILPGDDDDVSFLNEEYINPDGTKMAYKDLFWWIDKNLSLILKQLGPWEQLGVNEKGEPLTLVDAVAALRKDFDELKPE